MGREAKRQMLDWRAARGRVNETLRRSVAGSMGEQFLERLLEEKVQQSMADWLEPYLGVDGRSGRGGRVADIAPTAGDELCRLLRPHVKAPSLLLAADSGALAATLGVTMALEFEPRRLQVARATFPEVDFRDASFFEQPDRYRTIAAVGYLRSLQQADGYGRLRDFFRAASDKLLSDGKLLVSDSVAFQDDVVSQLASFDFEIFHIAALTDSRNVAVLAKKVD